MTKKTKKKTKHNFITKISLNDLYLRSYQRHYHKKVFWEIFSYFGGYWKVATMEKFWKMFKTRTVNRYLIVKINASNLNVGCCWINKSLLSLFCLGFLSWISLHLSVRFNCILQEISFDCFEEWVFTVGLYICRYLHSSINIVFSI